MINKFLFIVLICGTSLIMFGIPYKGGITWQPISANLQVTIYQWLEVHITHFQSSEIFNYYGSRNYNPPLGKSVMAIRFLSNADVIISSNTTSSTLRIKGPNSDVWDVDVIYTAPEGRYKGDFCRNPTTWLTVFIQSLEIARYAPPGVHTVNINLYFAPTFELN